MHVDAARDAVGELALHEMRDAAGELDHVDAASDLAAGVVEDLPMFARDACGELVLVREQQFAVAEEDVRAHGPRIQHFAYTVADLKKAVLALRKRGISFDSDAILGGDEEIIAIGVEIEAAAGQRVRLLLDLVEIEAVQRRGVALGVAGGEPERVPLSTKPGDRVLDLTAGSGSTLIACDQLKRKAFLMEIEPVFCDLIVRRYEAATGNKASLLKS